MAKDKLKRFAEFKTFTNTFDFPYELKGKWNSDVFKNDHPIVLELGCGKGEYTVALGREYKDKNFIGIDLKSNRMWKGAQIANEEKLNNVAFMRIVIDKVAELFEAGEVSEIWITFPDPFPKGRHAKHRLTHPRFLRSYKKILKKGGTIHFKTDDTDLFDFTMNMLPQTGVEPGTIDWDVHHNPAAHAHLKQITTYYEKLFMGRGRTIKYAAFSLDNYDDARAMKWEEDFKKLLKEQATVQENNTLTE
jgi:tRNA (guanine-N7-)-methyltransferase